MSEGEVVHTSSTGGQKAGNDVRGSLVPWREVLEVFELFGKGAKKYDDHNWRKGYKWSLSHDALHRHLAEWWLGNEFDDGEGGTGLEHLTCVIFHALVLMWFRKHRPQFDDRYSTFSEDPEKHEPSVVPFLTSSCRNSKWIKDFSGSTYWFADGSWWFKNPSYEKTIRWCRDHEPGARTGESSLFHEVIEAK